MNGSPKEEYKETLLNGSDPVLKDGLIPVTIENDGTVRRADIHEKWYEYGNKEWANAVILENQEKSYSIGEVIPEKEIQSYFVWIPRYRYKLWNADQADGYIEGKPTTGSNAQTIDIVFESKEISSSRGLKNGEYLTHPAFTNFNVNGLWVGKYETGYKGASTR